MTSASRPLYPRKRIFAVRQAMSAKCQKRTNAGAIGLSVKCQKATSCAWFEMEEVAN